MMDWDKYEKWDSDEKMFDGTGSPKRVIFRGSKTIIGKRSAGGSFRRG